VNKLKIILKALDIAHSAKAKKPSLYMYSIFLLSCLFFIGGIYLVIHTYNNIYLNKSTKNIIFFIFFFPYFWFSLAKALNAKTLSQMPRHIWVSFAHRVDTGNIEVWLGTAQMKYPAAKSNFWPIFPGRAAYVLHSNCVTMRVSTQHRPRGTPASGSFSRC
jgi:hypothetical protein